MFKGLRSNLENISSVLSIQDLQNKNHTGKENFDQTADESMHSILLFAAAIGCEYITQ